MPEAAYGVLVGTLERERSVRGAGQREGYQAKYFFKRKTLSYVSTLRVKTVPAAAVCCYRVILLLPSLSTMQPILPMIYFP